MQRKCLEFVLQAKPESRVEPKNRLQKKVIRYMVNYHWSLLGQHLFQLWQLVSSSLCEFIVLGAIVLNTLALAVKHHNQPEVHN